MFKIPKRIWCYNWRCFGGGVVIKGNIVFYMKESKHTVNIDLVNNLTLKLEIMKCLTCLLERTKVLLFSSAE